MTTLSPLSGSVAHKHRGVARFKLRDCRCMMSTGCIIERFSQRFVSIRWRR
jgi:hypothetical protein